jgi:hypothetical protein
LSNLDAGHPALVLTPLTLDHSASAHVGDMVQVRLPTTTKWTYDAAQVSGPLIPAQPSGVLVRAVSACVWTFKANAKGAELLTFEGQAICRAGQPCPNFRVKLAFSVSIV